MMKYWTIICVVILAGFIAYSWRDDFHASSVRGKRVLITGASAGIGEQMAYHYARMGARLVVTARTESKLQQVIENCGKLGQGEDGGGHYYYIVADMGDLNDTHRVIQFAEEKLGGLDHLVLNHIVTSPLAEWRGTEDNFWYLDKIIDVNFKAYVYLASNAMPMLEESSGSIIVVSSLSGKLGQPYTAVYSASKHALMGFFSSLRQEHFIRDVDVSITTCVIGFIGTENALEQLRKFGLDFLIDYITPADPADAALAIIKGGETRTREIYYPYVDTKLTTLFKDWFPQTLERFLRYLYQKPAS